MPLYTSFMYSSSTTVPVTQDPDAVAFGRFVSAYDGAGLFTADINFYEEFEAGTPILQEIELVSYNSPVNGFVVTQHNATTLRLSGTASNVIPGSFFTFLMPDKTIKVLPPDTTEDFDTLLAWNPPGPKMIQVTHTMDVRIKKTPSSSNYIETLNVTQEIYWRYQFGIQAFQSLLARGRL